MSCDFNTLAEMIVWSLYHCCITHHKIILNKSNFFKILNLWLSTYFFKPYIDFWEWEEKERETGRKIKIERGKREK